MAANYDKWVYAKDKHYISNCGHDERGKYNSGQAGDQTGDEWYIRTWYQYPYGTKKWDCVLRYEKDTAVAEKLMQLAVEAALNDKIGYDNYQRWTYQTLLEKAGDDPSKITYPCESDCSAGIIANTKAVGRLLNIPALATIPATYTKNMRNAYKNAGFTVLTDSKYLYSPDYLLPGDLLLNEDMHTCTNITVGSKAVWNPKGAWSGMDKTKYVKECYTSLLTRNASEKEAATWVARCSMMTPQEIMNNIAYSEEGMKAWVAMLYKLLLNREPDKDGMKYWINTMKAGKSRADVLNGIKGSPEYKNLHK